MLDQILLDVINQPNFLTNEESQNLFNYLEENCDFQQKIVNIDNRSTKVPRLIKWYGPYIYAYSGIIHPAQPLPPILQQLAHKITLYLQSLNVEAQFNSVLINYYRDGKDKIGMHGDDETQLGQNPVIASISLGTDRIFKMRHNQTKEKRLFTLHDGQLFIMKGNTQNEWMHGIDPEADKGVRINLTFRNIKYPPINDI